MYSGQKYETKLRKGRKNNPKKKVFINKIKKDKKIPKKKKLFFKEDIFSKIFDSCFEFINIKRSKENLFFFFVFTFFETIKIKLKFIS